MGESERKSLRDDCIEKENRRLLSEWDDKKNEGLMPEDVSAGSRRYVWWRCKNGHSWRASVQHRSRGSGCPVCDGKIAVPGDNDLLTLFPDIAAEWDTERNGNLTPDRVTPYSNRKAWWRCSRGHAWEAVIAPRAVKNAGCPIARAGAFCPVLMTWQRSTQSLPPSGILRATAI